MIRCRVPQCAATMLEKLQFIPELAAEVDGVGVYRLRRQPRSQGSNQAAIQPPG